MPSVQICCSVPDMDEKPPEPWAMPWWDYSVGRFIGPRLPEQAALQAVAPSTPLYSCDTREKAAGALRRWLNARDYVWQEPVPPPRRQASASGFTHVERRSALLGGAQIDHAFKSQKE